MRLYKKNSRQLFKSSENTFFTFKICGNWKYSEMLIKEICKTVQEIYEKGYYLEYVGIDNKLFLSNLLMIDSRMDEIIADALLIFWSGKAEKLNDICDLLTNRNSLKISPAIKSLFYKRKLNHFLLEIFNGLTSTTVWHGSNNTSIYYDVEDGTKKFINRNLFEDYLLENTRLDTPSSTRHGFGLIFFENGEPFIKLNLQIRFI